MRFNTLTLIIILICSATSIIFNFAYGQEQQILEMAERATNAAEADAKLTIRMGDIIQKCGTYLVEKGEAGITPSKFVVQACMELTEGFRDAVTKFFDEFAYQAMKIE
jgi:hypothetical protein